MLERRLRNEGKISYSGSAKTSKVLRQQSHQRKTLDSERPLHDSDKNLIRSSYQLFKSTLRDKLHPGEKNDSEDSKVSEKSANFPDVRKLAEESEYSQDTSIVNSGKELTNSQRDTKNGNQGALSLKSSEKKGKNKVACLNLLNCSNKFETDGASKLKTIQQAPDQITDILDSVPSLAEAKSHETGKVNNVLDKPLEFTNGNTVEPSKNPLQSNYSTDNGMGANFPALKKQGEGDEFSSSKENGKSSVHEDMMMFDYLHARKMMNGAGAASLRMSGVNLTQAKLKNFHNDSKDNNSIDNHDFRGNDYPVDSHNNSLNYTSNVNEISLFTASTAKTFNRNIVNNKNNNHYEKRNHSNNNINSNITITDDSGNDSDKSYFIVKEISSNYNNNNTRNSNDYNSSYSKNLFHPKVMLKSPKSLPKSELPPRNTVVLNDLEPYKTLSISNSNKTVDAELKEAGWSKVPGNNAMEGKMLPWGNYLTNWESVPRKVFHGGLLSGKMTQGTSEFEPNLSNGYNPSAKDETFGSRRVKLFGNNKMASKHDPFMTAVEVGKSGIAGHRSVSVLHSSDPNLQIPA